MLLMLGRPRRANVQTKHLRKSDDLVAVGNYYVILILNSVKQNIGERKTWLLVGKPEGKRPRRRWANNIKIDLLQIGWGGVDWIGLAQDRDKWRALVNAVMNLRVP
jgi:hypothetical protein